MSEERDTEQAGAPVEQAEVTETQVMAAVERAGEMPAAANEPADPADLGSPAPAEAGEPAPGEVPAAQSPDHFVAASPAAPAAAAPAEPAVAVAAPVHDVTAPPATTVMAPTELPSAGPQPDYAAQQLPPVRDGEIRINADHPMAALYMQSPMPPDMRGNRGAGVLIALLATVVFALIYAGVLALWLAPELPPSRFLSDGLVPVVVSWSYFSAVAAFFVGLSVLVLIVGRAGWWAYVVFGFIVAAFVWAVALTGIALDVFFAGGRINANPLEIVQEYGLAFPIITAGIVAREIIVWFGAWIGARGRKIKRQNADALVEYEAALAEVQGK